RLSCRVASSWAGVNDPGYNAGATPAAQSVVRLLGFALVLVEAAARLSSKHFVFPQPLQHSRRVIASAERLLQRFGNVDRNIDTNLINQAKGTHRHSPIDERLINFLSADPTFEKLDRVKEIRKQNAIDQKTGPVADDDWQLVDLPNECESTLARLVRRLVSHDNFD